MSVNVITGPGNQLTRIAGLSMMSGSTTIEYVTVEKETADITYITNQFNDLRQFVNNISLGEDVIVQGYYYNGQFYEEAAHTTLIQGDRTKLYVDLGSDVFLYYRYNGSEYVQEAYYRITGGTIQGWCEVQNGNSLYAPSGVYFATKAAVDAHTGLGSMPKIYYDSTPATGSGEDAGDPMGLALKNGSNKIMIGDKYTYVTKSLNLRTNSDGNISGFGPHVILNRRSGIYGYDQQVKQYPMLYQNIENLWIGAAEAQNYHHKGQTYISSGWCDDENAQSGWSGNRSVYIAVPKYNEDSPYVVQDGSPNDASLYEVIHSGNLRDFTINNASFIRDLKTALGI